MTVYGMGASPVDSFPTTYSYLSLPILIIILRLLQVPLVIFGLADQSYPLAYSHLPEHRDAI